MEDDDRHELRVVRLDIDRQIADRGQGHPHDTHTSQGKARREIGSLIRAGELPRPHRPPRQRGRPQ